MMPGDLRLDVVKEQDNTPHVEPPGFYQEPLYGPEYQWMVTSLHEDKRSIM